VFPRNACAASRSDTIHSPPDAISARLRRSTASAIAPPYRPNPISGNSANTPTRPTANDDPVSVYTWIATATVVICWPSWATALPKKSRRYAAETFSGRMSVTRPRNLDRTPVRTRSDTGTLSQVARINPLFRVRGRTYRYLHMRKEVVQKCILYGLVRWLPASSSPTSFVRAAG
jgi:hypothetical protein